MTEFEFFLLPYQQGSPLQCSFLLKKKSLFDQLTKHCLNTGSYKKASIYQHQDIETLPLRKKIYDTAHLVF